jgi:hypothetical protein
MKRAAVSRRELAIHEAGHLVAIASMSKLTAQTLNWRRTPRYELTHCEAVPTHKFDWRRRTGRNELIARRAIVALAGGAAVAASSDAAARTLPSLRDIHDCVGTVDFELAHVWLTLQCHDPDQRSLELEIQHLYTKISGHLRLSTQRNAISVVGRRLADRLTIADRKGLDFLDVPAHELLAGLEIQGFDDIGLDYTVK